MIPTNGHHFVNGFCKNCDVKATPAAQQTVCKYYDDIGMHVGPHVIPRGYTKCGHCGQEPIEWDPMICESQATRERRRELRRYSTQKAKELEEMAAGIERDNKATPNKPSEFISYTSNENSTGHCPHCGESHRPGSISNPKYGCWKEEQKAEDKRKENYRKLYWHRYLMNKE